MLGVQILLVVAATVYCLKIKFKNVMPTRIQKAKIQPMLLLSVFLHDCTSSCSENCTKYSKWICYTCHRKIISGNIPPEAAANNMHLETVPKELSCLNSLEQNLISLHIPFMKVMALPKGGQKIFMVQWCVFPLI